MAFANNIAYAALFQTVLDEQMVQESTTGWMDANAGNIIYNGGKDVKIPALSMTGLGDYSRTAGYPEGSLTLAYENFTMTQDRGAQFLLDRMDVDETNFAANAITALSEFQRTQVIPEVDAYRISKIANYAISGFPGTEKKGTVEYGYTPGAASTSAPWWCMSLATALPVWAMSIPTATMTRATSATWSRGSPT